MYFRYENLDTFWPYNIAKLYGLGLRKIIVNGYIIFLVIFQTVLSRYLELIFDLSGTRV